MHIYALWIMSYYFIVEASEFVLGFLCNCFSCFTTMKITFTSGNNLLLQNNDTVYKRGFAFGQLEGSRIIA